MDKILLSPQDLHDAVSAVLSDISIIRYAVSDKQCINTRSGLSPMSARFAQAIKSQQKTTSGSARSRT